MEAKCAGRGWAAAVALVASGLVAGCDGSVEVVDRDPPVLHVALGAEVTLVLAEHSCDGSPAQACLYEEADDLIGAGLREEGVIALGEVSRPDRRSVAVEVRALSVGDAYLELDYRDFFGHRYHDLFIVRVAEITRVDVRVSCDRRREGAVTHPVAAGSTFGVGAEASAAGVLLATGALPLVADWDGFEVVGDDDEPTDFWVVAAPDETGPRTWTLVGDESEDVSLFVYAAEDVAAFVEATAGDRFEPPGVVVDRSVDGVPVCVFEGETLVALEVEAGDCRPVVGDFELEGSATLVLGDRAALIELTGHGTCVVTATIDGGEAAEVEVAVDNPPPPVERGQGVGLGPAPFEIPAEVAAHGECERVRNLTNGACEVIDAGGVILPDADCLLDWEWVAFVRDGERDVDPDGARFGVGLLAELRLGVDYELFWFLDVARYPPTRLRVIDSPPGLDLQSRGCAGGTEVFEVLFAAAGELSFSLGADNVLEPYPWSPRVREVADVVVRTDAATRFHDWEPWFVGSRTAISAVHRDASGRELVGAATLRVSADSDEAGATIAEGEVHTGVRPQTIRIGSSAAPQSFELRVVDGTAIASLSGIEPRVVPFGESHCFSLAALDAEGRRIAGRSPIRPRLATAGEGGLAVELDHWPPPDDGELCVLAVARGTVEVSVAWGAAAAAETWTVP